MTIEQIACSQCGAPLILPQGARFVTCNHCQASLAVRHNETVTYTEAIQHLAQRTDEIADHLADLRRERELERIDREWDLQRKSLLMTSKRGEAYVPTTSSGVFAIVVGGGFGLFWTIMAVEIAGRMPGIGVVFPVFGVLFIVMSVVEGLKMISAADAYRREEAAYRQRRAAATGSRADSD